MNLNYFPARLLFWSHKSLPEGTLHTISFVPGRRWDKGTSLGLLDIPRDGGACSPQSMNEGLENNGIQQKEDKKKPTVLISFKFVASYTTVPK